MIGSVAGAAGMAALGAPVMGALETETNGGNAMLSRAKWVPRSVWESSDLHEFRIVRTLIDACPDRGCLGRDSVGVHVDEYEDGRGGDGYERHVILGAGIAYGRSARSLETMYASLIRVCRSGYVLGVVDSLTGDLRRHRFRIEASARDFGRPEAPVWKWHHRMASGNPGLHGSGPLRAMDSDRAWILTRNAA